MADSPDVFYLCSECSYPIRAEKGLQALQCQRCGYRNMRLQPKSISMTLAFSLTALVLYIPANIFPFMTIELYGNRNSSTIWDGIVSLVDAGSWPIAVIIFLASIVIPLLKLLILFYLALTAHNSTHAVFKTRLYHFVEVIGRWSMLDIFLLAVLVALMKLGHWANVQPEIGSLLFAGVVVFTMLASAKFDPRLFWEDQL